MHRRIATGLSEPPFLGRRREDCGHLVGLGGGKGCGFASAYGRHSRVAGEDNTPVVEVVGYMLAELGGSD